jgi:hypothetical protein
MAEQRALVGALAEERGKDVETTTAEVHVVDAESVAENDDESAASNSSD